MKVPSINRASGAAVGFVLAIILFVAISVAVKLSLRVPGIDEDRQTQIGKALADLRAAEEKSLTTSGPIDAQRGIVRLPIDDAMKLAADKWQNPAAARADLISRAEKSTAPVTAKPGALE